MIHLNRYVVINDRICSFSFDWCKGKIDGRIFDLSIVLMDYGFNLVLSAKTQNLQIYKLSLDDSPIQMLANLGTPIQDQDVVDV